MTDTNYHKGPPPVGSAWSNTQETRVVLHTNGTHANAYTVQYEVWRGFPERKRCGTNTVNGYAWNYWVWNAKRSAHPADGGGDMGNREPDAPGDGSPSSAMEGRPAVAPDDRLVGPKQSNPPVQGMGERGRVVHLAQEQQRKKDRR